MAPSNEAIVEAARHRDESRAAASKVGVVRTPLAVMRAEEAQRALEAAHAAVHAPSHRPHREVGSTVLPHQAPRQAPHQAHPEAPDDIEADDVPAPDAA